MSWTQNGSFLLCVCVKAAIAKLSFLTGKTLGVESSNLATSAMKRIDSAALRRRLAAILSGTWICREIQIEASS